MYKLNFRIIVHDLQQQQFLRGEKKPRNKSNTKELRYKLKRKRRKLLLKCR